MPLTLDIKTNPDQSYVTQLQDQLRTQIRRRTLKPEQKLPTLRQMAEQAGVSMGIVRQAISTLTTEGYIQSRQGSGMYVALPGKRSRMIALVLPALDFERIPMFIRGVKAGLAGLGNQLLIQAADYDYDQEIDLLTNLDSSFIAGAIIFPPPMQGYEQPLLELRQRDVPFVLLESFFQLEGIASVQVDRFELGRLAAESLMCQGHRRIGMILAWQDTPWLNQFQAGMDQVLCDYGMSFTDLVQSIHSPMHLDSEQPWARGEKIAQELLTQHPDLTAIVGGNANITIGLMQAAEKLERKVPEDLSVICLEGKGMMIEYRYPAVTIIDLPEPNLLGEVAGKQFAKLLQGHDEPAQNIRLSPELFENASEIIHKNDNTNMSV